MTDIHEIDSLKERIARIEKTVAEIKDSIGGEEGDGWWGGDDKSDAADLALTDEEMQLVRDGKKINAIKLYHERTGQGLKEAKDAIDAFDG